MIMHLNGKDIDMINACSSNLSYFGYDDTDQELYVYFNNGGLWWYENVTKETFDIMNQANNNAINLKGENINKSLNNSVGKFFCAIIKKDPNKYVPHKIR
jgi:hypothetical protein